MADDLTLIAGAAGNKRAIAGWTEVRVTRSLERMPSDFEIALTEKYPGQADALIIQDGDPCQVKIGDDLVITGYIDRFLPAYSAQRHSVRVIGRSMSEDLVDCSVLWSYGQMRDVAMLQFARNLARPYGVEINLALSDGESSGEPIQQYNVDWSETVFEAIERYARLSAFLVYDLPDGSVLLSRVGKKSAAGALVEGKNVEAAQAERAMDQRFSEIRLRRISTDRFRDAAPDPSEDVIAVANDSDVPRLRVANRIAEGGDVSDATARRRIIWEKNHRRARAQPIRITTDSWRDAAGALWEPNTLVPVALPRLKVPSLIGLIGEVTYRRDDTGTHADLLIMDPQGFDVKPELAPWIARSGDVQSGAGRP